MAEIQVIDKFINQLFEKYSTLAVLVNAKVRNYHKIKSTLNMIYHLSLYLSVVNGQESYLQNAILLLSGEAITVDDQIIITGIGDEDINVVKHSLEMLLGRYSNGNAVMNFDLRQVTQKLRIIENDTHDPDILKALISLTGDTLEE